MEESRIRERGEAERRSLDDVVRARMRAEEHARENERMRDEAESRLRDQRERVAREEGVRLQATHHASVVAMREKLERDLREIESIKASMGKREALWQTRARIAWIVAFFSTTCAVGSAAFAMLARDPSGTLAHVHQLGGVALELRSSLEIERGRVTQGNERIALLERTVDELRSRPIAVATQTNPKTLIPPTGFPPKTTDTGRGATKTTLKCAEGDPLCGAP